MSHARPLTRLVAESLQSLPWTRSSVSLGRPYRSQYRFRRLHAQRRRASALPSSEHPEFGLLEQQQEEEQEARLTLSNDPWETPAQEDGEGGPVVFNPVNTRKEMREDTVENTGENTAEDMMENTMENGKIVKKHTRKNSTEIIKKNILAHKNDPSLLHHYDARVTIAENSLQVRSTNELYDILRFSASEGAMTSIIMIQACVNCLIKDHGVQPNLRLYSALILAQCRSDGSCAEVYRLLEEMDGRGIELDIGACHDVLKALSVHPDYLLLTDVLQYMRSKWFQLSDDGWHHVTASLIRQGSFEMALDRLEGMRTEGIRILGWLYDLMIYALAEKGEMDEVLLIIKQRIREGDMNFSVTMWYHLLDMACRTLHYELAVYIWKSQVKARYVNPHSGICTNMMLLGVRNKDVELVQDVFKFLGDRDTVFEGHHYEMVIEAYVNTGMAENGFYILSAMQQADVVPNEGTTRHIFRYLKGDLDRIHKMYDVLKTIKENGEPIPVAAMNVLIEAATNHEVPDLALALELYKAIPDMCVGPADLTTFHTLFKMCRLQRRKDLALQLVGEMVALRITPDMMAYDRMMLVCLLEDDYEDAVSYYKEMRAKKMEPRFGTALRFVRTLAEAGDPRVHDVLDDVAGMDIPVRMPELRRWVTENYGKRDEAKGMDVEGDNQDEKVEPHSAEPKPQPLFL